MTASKRHAITLLGLVLTVVITNAFAYSGQKLAAKATISLEQARVIDLKAQPGEFLMRRWSRGKTAAHATPSISSPGRPGRKSG